LFHRKKLSKKKHSLYCFTAKVCHISTVWRKKDKSKFSPNLYFHVSRFSITRPPNLHHIKIFRYGDWRLDFISFNFILTKQIQKKGYIDAIEKFFRSYLTKFLLINAAPKTCWILSTIKTDILRQFIFSSLVSFLKNFHKPIF
jgi:hypothetical protein